MKRFTLVMVAGLLLTPFTGQSRAEEVTKKTYPEWHMQEKDGLGFGLGLSSMPGILLFYDHNLSGKTQLHIQVDVNGESRETLMGEKLLTVSRNMGLITYRYFPATNNGLYLGAGGGFAGSTLEYKSSSLSSTQYTYTSKSNGGFLMGEIGWQGSDGYYFHIGYQPAAYIFSSDDYDVNSIPNTSNHRTAADEEHNKLKSLSQLSIGFGWFF